MITCSLVMPLLSLPILIASLIASGKVAILIIGSSATIIFAIHCCNVS